MMYKPSIAAWLKILSPAILFPAAQLLAKHLLMLLGAGSNAGAIASCLICPVVILCFCRLREPEASPHRMPRGREFLLWLGITAGLAVFNLVLFPSAAPAATSLYWLASVICAPISEELIYRGLVFEQAQKHLGLPAAVVLSSLLFGAVHGPLISCIAAALLGAVLCWMRTRFRCIAAPIATHAVLNLTVLLF